MLLFEFTIFEHLYGVGISFDLTLISHALIYGGTVVLVALLWAPCQNSALRSGLLASLTASLFLEINQMYQWHWECGFFGIGDIVVSWASAYIVYLLLVDEEKRAVVGFKKLVTD